jgi:hypothetical protein
VLGILGKEIQTRLLQDDVALTKVVSYCQSIENVDAKNKNQSKPKKK